MRFADTHYSPLYFLGALGAGGITVTFFMALMFWVPHPGQPVPVFEDLLTAFTTGGILLKSVIAAAWAGIAVFAALMVKTLIWNLAALARFKRTDAYRALISSNAEVTLQAAPLAVAMAINVGFIVGLVFVPQLWTLVEYLFPAAMAGFGAVAVWSLLLMARYLGRILSGPGAFDMSQHASFAQMLPAFTLAMIGVGLAAPSAMSLAPATVAVSLMLSTVFATLSILYAMAAGLSALPAMLQHGVAREAGPTLMILVPLMTVLGILFLRQSHGLHTTFEAHGNAGETLGFLTTLLTLQVAALGLGMAVMRAQGYFRDYVLGDKRSAGSYALVCPAVALSVMVHFFANKGLVGAGVIEKFGTGYWSLSAVAVMLQILAIALVLRLNRQHFASAPEARLAV